MILEPNRDEYLVCWTPVLQDKQGGSYCCQLVKKDVPEEILADMREVDREWRKQHRNHPRYIFPDDPDYKKYLPESAES